MGWSPKRYITLLLLIGVTALQAEIKSDRESNREPRKILKLDRSILKAPRTYTKGIPKTVKARLSEDFESGAIPPEWTVIDRDADGYQWYAYSGATYAHSGSYSAAVHWNAAGNDDWLITPPLLPQANDSFTFWARSHSASYPEDFEILVSTTTTDPDSFVSIASVTSVPETYTYYAYDLSSYAGETIYVAIRCVSVNEFYLHVDDVAGPELYIVDTTAPTVNVVAAPNPHFYTGSDDQVVAVVSDISGVANVVLSYTTDLGSTWNDLQMVEVAPDTYSVNIPAQPRGTKIYWGIYAQDSAGNGDYGWWSYYTIMPSGDELVVYSYGTEAMPLIYGLMHNGLDPLPDYMYKLDAITFSDSLPYWVALLVGETGELGTDMLDALNAYLATGVDTMRKRLIIFGDDIAYYANSNGYLSTLHNVLRVNYIKDDMSSSTDNDTIVGVAGDPISDTMPQFTISSGYPDMVEPWTPWQGVDLPWKFLININGDSTNTAGGIAYNGLKYQIFYMPYEVSEIDSQAYVDTLLNRIYLYASSDIMPPTPDWCGIQWPQADTVVAGVDTLSDMIYGQVYEAGVTDVGVQDSANFIVELGIGPSGTMPDDNNWTWVPAVFNTAHGNGGNNYEYMAQIDVRSLQPGVYDYAFRFSFNGGPWVYADWGSSGGSSDGYQPENAGKLYVTLNSPIVSIYDVQDTTDATFAGDTSNYFGQTVTVIGVVTGVYGNGFFLEDPAGGAWSGIWVYKNGADTIVESGDSLIVEGAVSEHYGLTEIVPDTIIVAAKNAALPTPVVISTGAT